MKQAAIAVLVLLSGELSAATPTVQWNTTFARDTGGEDAYLGSLTDDAGNTRFLVREPAGYALVRSFDAGGVLASTVTLEEPATYLNAKAFAADAAGNLYVAGSSWAGSENAAVAKYSPAGSLVWFREYDGGATERAVAVAVDGGGNVLLAGDLLGGGGIPDALLVKYDAAGAFGWAQAVDCGYTDSGYGVTVDPAGNAYLIGAAYTVGWRMLLVKFNAGGAPLFSRTYTATGWDYGRAAAFRPADGSVYVAWDRGGGGSGVIGVARIDASTGDLLGASSHPAEGATAGGIALGAGGEIFVAGVTCCDAGGAEDLLAVGFGAGPGAVLPGWPVRYDSGGDDGGEWSVPKARVGVDSANRVYLSGEAKEGGCVKPDLVVQQLDAAGGEIWGRRYDSPPAGGSRIAGGLTSDAEGHPVVGVHSGSAGIAKVDAASGAVLWTRFYTDANHCAMNLSSSEGLVHYGGLAYVAMSGVNAQTNRSDIVLAMYDSAGDVSATAGMANGSDLSAGPVAVDGWGNAYVAGSFWNAAAGEEDLLLVKFDRWGEVAWSRTMTFAATDIPMGIGLDAQGGVYVLENYPYDGLAANGYGVLKFSALTGEMTWSRVFSGGMAEGFAGGLVARGADVYFSGTDVDSLAAPAAAAGRLVRIDASGSQVWTSGYAGTPAAKFSGLALDAAGNVFCAGITGAISPADDWSVLAVSYDASGAVRWAESFNSGWAKDEGVDAAVGSVYVGANGNGVVRLIKYAETGNEGGQPVLRGALEGWLSQAPALLSEGDRFKLALTVSNTGREDVLAVRPTIAAGGGSPIRLDSGPAPASVARIAPGAAAQFLWSGRAVGAGTLALTALAAGTDAGDGAEVGVQVRLGGEVRRREFTEAVVVYPSPVEGDRLTLAVSLEADAERVTVEAYNAAFQRVFTGSWRGVSRTGERLVVDGVARWAPGVYLVRVSADLAGGGRQVLPVTKVMVRR